MFSMLRVLAKVDLVRKPSEFQIRFQDRMVQIARESGLRSFVVPVGLVFVLDRAHGGDDTAEELVRRFHLMDSLSGDVIDFYFVGWGKDSTGSINFDLESFAEWIREYGVPGLRFGGNADLVLFDAYCDISKYGDRDLEIFRMCLDFERAIHLDLSTLVAEKRVSSLGQLISKVIYAASETYLNTRAPTVQISNSLGLAIARESLLDYILDKLAGIIGASKVRHFATRKLGPKLRVTQALFLRENDDPPIALPDTQALPHLEGITGISPSQRADESRE